MRFLILFFCLQFFYTVDLYAKSETPSLSPWLYKKLQKTEQLIDKKQYSEAEKLLKQALNKVDKESYGQATVLRSLASVFALRDQYKKAANYLSQAVQLNLLPESQQKQALMNLAQLYLADEQYKKAIQTLEPWLEKGQIAEPELNALVANAYAQLKQYHDALGYIEKAILLTKKPNESWYQLNLALLYQLNKYRSAVSILKTLLRYYPDKKQYWSQLSSVYQQLNQHKKAVSIQHLAYKKGLLDKENEIINLAQLYLYTHAPYKAARILQDELANKRVKSTAKNWEMLANAWQMAKENDLAIKALKQASSLSDKGSLYQQLGQIYVSQEDWKNAVLFLNKAVGKGRLKNAGSTYLLMGMSYWELKDIENAKKNFKKAAKYNKNKKAANQWLAYIKENHQMPAIN